MHSFSCGAVLALSVLAAGLPSWAGPPIIISEVMYNPKDISDTLGEWVELFNPLEQAVDLTDYAIGDLSGTRFRFAAGALLEAGKVLIVARSSAALENGGPQLFPEFFP